MTVLKGARVLVVEDEGIVAMLMEEMLDALGCEVVATAAELTDAKSQAQSAQIDVATLDVNLAGHLSYPVAEILRTRNIPFLFVTGYGNRALPPEMELVPVLAKPFTCADLARLISKGLGRTG